MWKTKLFAGLDEANILVALLKNDCIEYKCWFEVACGAWIVRWKVG